MDKEYLIDTNIIIYYLNNDIPDDEIEKIEQIFATSFYISTITKIEVLGWYGITEREKERIEIFLSNAKVFYIDKAIEKRSIEIKQKCKIATPDTIIGSTALEYNFIVATRNETDFGKINGLKIYNPFK